MRTTTITGVLAAIGLAMACNACGSDTGTSLGSLERRGGYSGSGAPSLPASSDPTSASNGGGSTPSGSTSEGSTPSPMHDAGAASGNTPIETSDAGAGTGAGNGTGNGNGTGAGTGTSGTSTDVGGCPNGCSDGCLTMAITFCKTATADFQDFCAQVPASCACNTTGTTPPAPSLQQCIADIENGADNDGDDDTGN